MAARPPIVVYPNKTKLAALCAGQVLFALGCLAVCVWIVISPPSYTADAAGAETTNVVMIFCTTILVPILAYLAAGECYQLLRHQPAVTVTEEGLIDNCSLLFCGVGLIRWQEMYAVLVVPYKTPGLIQMTQWYLTIVLRDDNEFFRQRSAALRRLRWIVTALSFSHAIRLNLCLSYRMEEYVWGSLRTEYETQCRKNHALRQLPEIAFGVR